MLAKQLVKLRQQKTKSYGLSATITATGHQMKVSHDHHMTCHMTSICCHVIGYAVISSYDKSYGTNS